MHTTDMKEITFRKEEMFLSPYACKSADTKGRVREEQPCPLRTDFQRDRDRIIHSKSFRRLKSKTQVFLSPEGDHYRTRLTHTLDVSQIARSIARALSLNEDLAEAVALGHDLGHTPFGHAGERTLQRITEGRFEHSEQSVRVAEILENSGEGLNLTFEVLDGIKHHQTEGSPSTLEGRCVQIADKIAYVNHDVDDAVRAGLFKLSDIPRGLTEILGSSSRERINNMINSVYRESAGKNRAAMEPEVFEATYALRDFLFDRVYNQPFAKREEERSDRLLTRLYEYYFENPSAMPPFYVELVEKFGLQQAVCDFITGMSDRYCVHTFESLFIPSSWKLDM